MTAKNPKSRLRVATITIQVEFMLDDGTDLTPVVGDARRMTTREFAEFDLDAFAAGVQQKLDDGAISLLPTRSEDPN